MAAYILCTRDTREPCTLDGTVLSWPLASGAVLIEDADLIPHMENDKSTFLLLMEIDYNLSEALTASPEELPGLYPDSALPFPVMMVDRGGNQPSDEAYWRVLHAHLQEAVIEALITTESAFGADAIAS